MDGCTISYRELWQSGSGQLTAIKHGILSVRAGMAWHVVSFTAYVNLCSYYTRRLSENGTLSVCEQYTLCA